MGKAIKGESGIKAGAYKPLEGSFSRGGVNAPVAAAGKPKVNASWGSVKSKQGNRLFTAEEVTEMIKAALNAVGAGRDVDSVVAEIVEEEAEGDIVVSGR
jgi:hypothetical protein